MIIADEYQYYWEALDGKRYGGPFRTLSGLKSALQTGNRGKYYDRENNCYRNCAEDGVTIYKYRISYEPISSEKWVK